MLKITKAKQLPSPLSFENARAFFRLPRETKRSFIETLSDEEALHLTYMWEAWARDKQLEPPGNWTTWLLLAGRGFGKSRTGAEWIRSQVERGICGRLALVARTAADVRDVLVEGESGIMAISPPWFMPRYEPSKRRLTWPNGAQATTYSAEEPDALRGPQHDGAWADELAAWQNPDAWDQLMFGLRLGKQPRVVGTTTPRVTPLVKALAKSPTTHLTTGTTYENKSNLAPTFFTEVIKKYEGSRLGRQELLAELLEDAESALWKRSLIEEQRVTNHPSLMRVVVAVDPAVSDQEESAETGIVVAGVGSDGHGYVLDDMSVQASPHQWALQVVAAYYKYHADRIIGEQNNGGQLVEANLRTVDPSISYTQVYASRGKYTRAEPVSALYEQGRVHHVGTFPKLEDQMCQWEPLTGQKSPDRLDALVWALTKLMLGNTHVGGMALVADPDEDRNYDDSEEEEDLSLWR